MSPFVEDLAIVTLTQHHHRPSKPHTCQSLCCSISHCLPVCLSAAGRFLYKWHQRLEGWGIWLHVISENASDSTATKHDTKLQYSDLKVVYPLIYSLVNFRFQQHCEGNHFRWRVTDIYQTIFLFSTS